MSPRRAASSVNRPRWLPLACLFVLGAPRILDIPSAANAQRTPTNAEERTRARSRTIHSRQAPIRNEPRTPTQNPSATHVRKPPNGQFDGQAAMDHLKAICAIGRRVSGSAGMLRQQKQLTDHFRDLGGQVSLQSFDVRHPETGRMVRLGNLLVQWHPHRRERILLCCHYDTRPYPDEDRHRPRGVFLGANDGASGVAALMELGRLMPALKSRYGVDFVFFDAEEFVFDKRRDPLFLGSEHFARTYVAHPPPYRYRAGVLLDMVGDAHLEIYKERNSMKYAGTMVNDLWSIAAKMGVREFKSRIKHDIRDDHLALNQIAKIPTCDIIDFDYPRPGFGAKYWHTEADTPDKCSAESLEKVGKVVYAWLQRIR